MIQDQFMVKELAKKLEFNLFCNRKWEEKKKFLIRPVLDQGYGNK